MDRAQLLNDAEEAMRLVLDGRQSTMWTAIPGIVTDVNLAKMTCSVQPAIQGTIFDESGKTQNVNLPVLVDVPICFPSGGGFIITMPIKADDEVLVVFSSRCLDAWWQSGGIQRPMEARMHDLSDGFAIPGPRSVPKVAPAINTSDLQIRNNAGTVYLSIGADGKIGFKNATTDLKTVLTDLETLLKNFMDTLAGFSGGGSPVSQSMLQVPAATASTALAAVLVKIGALLK